MQRIIFTLVLIWVMGVIYLITGRNKRQIRRIPEGMGIVCQPPGKRYVLYAMGVIVVVVVGFFTVLYIMDGAPENARFMFGLCIAVALFTLFITVLGGNMMARDCVYFDGEKIQIEKPFKKPQIYKWSEIRKIDGDIDNSLNLYLYDGKKVLALNCGLINYNQFLKMLKLVCPELLADYYQTQSYEKPQKCVLRYGGEYYVLVALGFVITAMYLALILSGDSSGLLDEMLHAEQSELFSLWFGPVCGLVSIIFLFILLNTSIRYSGEKMVIKYLLRKKRELYWRQIYKIEISWEKRQGEEFWKKLRLYTPEKVYVINLQQLTGGKAAFLEELDRMMERYESPYEKVKRIF